MMCISGGETVDNTSVMGDKVGRIFKSLLLLIIRRRIANSFWVLQAYNVKKYAVNFLYCDKLWANVVSYR